MKAVQTFHTEPGVVVYRLEATIEGRILRAEDRVYDLPASANHHGLVPVRIIEKHLRQRIMRAIEDELFGERV